MPVQPLKDAWKRLQAIYDVRGVRRAPNLIEYDQPVQVVHDLGPDARRSSIDYWIFGLGATAPANANTEFIVNPFDRTDWTGVHKNGRRLTATAAGSAVDNDHDFYLTGAGFFFEGGSGVFSFASLYVDGEPDILTQVVRMLLARWPATAFSIGINVDGPIWQQPMPWYMPAEPYANVGADVFDLTLAVGNSDPVNGFNFDFWLTGYSVHPRVLGPTGL